MSIMDQLPSVKAIIAWGVKDIPDDIQKDARVYKFGQFLELGAKIKDDKIDELIDG